MSDEEEVSGYVPWWFDKLVKAETERFRALRQADGKVLPVNPGAMYLRYPGEEWSLQQKLDYHGIVQEDGDVRKSYDTAKKYAVDVPPAAPKTVLPKLGSFLRDPEPHDYSDFGG